MDGSTKGYAMIGGNGRSGTNWILQLLDASPETHCRSEPIDLEGSPFREIRPNLYDFADGDVETVRQRWPELLDWARSHAGLRDLPITVPKDHIWPLAVQLGLAQMPYRRRMRSALGVLWPRFRASEFALPWWLWRGDRVRDAFLALKMHVLAHHAVQILSDENARFVHNIRHPCGFLNSFLRRFYVRRDPETRVHWTCRTIVQLGRLVAADPERAELVTGFIKFRPVEASLWLWRFTNEDLITKCRGYSNYKLLVYEDAVLDPLATARDLFDFCGLKWSEDLEEVVARKATDSIFDGNLSSTVERRSLWKEQLEPENIALAERVLEGSFLRDFWQ